MSNHPLKYIYDFEFADRPAKRFEIDLDPDTLTILNQPQKDIPDWVKLNNRRCPGCPVNDAEPYCPAAKAMVELVDYFKSFTSWEEAQVRVTSSARTYLHQTQLQEAVSSLTGVYMVGGGCPVLAILKPMLRFHLPFSTIEETNYRTFSMYLLGQYFLAEDKLEPDWTFKRLVRVYERIAEVNHHFCLRVRAAVTEDASLNGIIVLDTLAGCAKFYLETKQLDPLKKLFKAYYLQFD